MSHPTKTPSAPLPALDWVYRDGVRYAQPKKQA